MPQCDTELPGEKGGQEEEEESDFHPTSVVVRGHIEREREKKKEKSETMN